MVGQGLDPLKVAQPPLAFKIWWTCWDLLQQATNRPLACWSAMKPVGLLAVVPTKGPAQRRVRGDYYALQCGGVVRGGVECGGAMRCVAVCGASVRAARGAHLAGVDGVVLRNRGSERPAADLHVDQIERARCNFAASAESTTGAPGRVNDGSPGGRAGAGAWVDDGGGARARARAAPGRSGRAWGAGYRTPRTGRARGVGVNAGPAYEGTRGAHVTATLTRRAVV